MACFGDIKEAVVNKWDEGYSVGYEAGRRNAAKLIHHELSFVVSLVAYCEDESAQQITDFLRKEINIIWDRDSYEKSGRL